jgi:SulP family sulfate permease
MRARTLASVSAGLVVGIIEVLVATSFAALIFGTAFPGRLADGVAVILGGAVVLVGVLAWTTGGRGVIPSIQDGPAVVLATAAAAAAAVASPSESAFFTVVATMAVTTALTGGAFLLIGAFRLGNLVRYVPYPVVGGFLAGTGWLLFKGGVSVAAGVAPGLHTLDDLASTDAVLKWLPALGLGVLLLLVTSFVHRPIAIPAAIAVALGAFWIGMLVTGTSVAEAQRGGWLFGPFPEAGLWRPWSLRALGEADWSAVIAQTTAIATTAFVAVLAMLMNVSGIELALGRDLDANAELRLAGVANVLAGGLGGIPGFHTLSLTALGRGMDASARLAGLVGAGIALVALVMGAALVTVIPGIVLGGILVFLGLGFLREWVLQARRTLPRADYATVLVILLAIAGWGLLTGVAVGLVLAVVLFAVSYSKTDVVRHASSGAVYRSNVERSPGEREALRELGEGVHVMRLQGFVFFGTASGLLDRIREQAAEAQAAGHPPLRFLVLDFRGVRGVDSSAVLSFAKTCQLASAQGFEIVLTAVPRRVRTQLEQGGVREDGAPVRFEPDLDRGLERCEDVLLDAERTTGRVHAADVWSSAGEPGSAGLARRIAPYLERTDLAAGEVLVRQGDPAGDVFLLESGRLTVELETAAGERLRLRTIRPGTMVGEVAHYTGAPRTASVVAETDSVVHRLDAGSIARMEAEAPELATELHRWFAGLLAQRLTDTLGAVDALLE